MLISSKKKTAPAPAARGSLGSRMWPGAKPESGVLFPFCSLIHPFSGAPQGLLNPCAVGLSERLIGNAPENAFAFPPPSWGAGSPLASGGLRDRSQGRCRRVQRAPGGVAHCMPRWCWPASVQALQQRPGRPLPPTRAHSAPDPSGFGASARGQTPMRRSVRPAPHRARA